LNADINAVNRRAERLNEIDLTIAGRKNDCKREIAGWDVYDFFRRQTKLLAESNGTPGRPVDSTARHGQQHYKFKTIEQG